MPQKQVTDMFDSQKPWLERQPGMIPWENGCAGLDDQLNQWLTCYSTEICDRPVMTTDPTHERFMQRLWDCWKYHWECAVARKEKTISGDEVAESIRRNEGYSEGGRLDGDPLYDVVLALAVMCSDNEATVIFWKKYRLLAIHVSRGIHPWLPTNPEEWWTDLVDFLAGYTKSPGILDTFRGESGLTPWLRVVIWRYLRRYPVGDVIRRPAPRKRKKKGKTKASDSSVKKEKGKKPGLLVGQTVLLGLECEIEIEATEKMKATADELTEIFKRLFSEAFASLPKEKRALLKLLFTDLNGSGEGPIRQNRAAAILGVHEGTIANRKKKAIESLRKTYCQLVLQEFQVQTHDDLLEQLRINPQDFAHTLFEILTDSADENEPPKRTASKQ